MTAIYIAITFFLLACVFMAPLVSGKQAIRISVTCLIMGILFLIADAIPHIQALLQ